MMPSIEENEARMASECANCNENFGGDGNPLGLCDFCRIDDLKAELTKATERAEKAEAERDELRRILRSLCYAGRAGTLPWQGCAPGQRLYLNKDGTWGLYDRRTIQEVPRAIKLKPDGSPKLARGREVIDRDADRAEAQKMKDFIDQSQDWWKFLPGDA